MRLARPGAKAPLDLWLTCRPSGQNSACSHRSALVTKDLPNACQPSYEVGRVYHPEVVSRRTVATASVRSLAQFPPECVELFVSFARRIRSGGDRFLCEKDPGTAMPQQHRRRRRLARARKRHTPSRFWCCPRGISDRTERPRSASGLSSSVTDSSSSVHLIADVARLPSQGAPAVRLRTALPVDTLSRLPLRGEQTDTSLFEHRRVSVYGL